MGAESMTVVPSSCRRTVAPSNQADQRSSRWPSTRIAYRSPSPRGLVGLVITLVSKGALAGGRAAFVGAHVRRRRGGRASPQVVIEGGDCATRPEAEDAGMDVRPV